MTTVGKREKHARGFGVALHIQVRYTLGIGSAFRISEAQSSAPEIVIQVHLVAFGPIGRWKPEHSPVFPLVMGDSDGQPVAQTL